MSNRALSPTMIGRQAQLAELHDYLRQAREGAGQVAFVSGEAGVGKTRLLREFLRGLADQPGLAIFSGHCFDERPAPPYGPFAELLRALGQAPEVAPRDEVAGPWADSLGDLMPALIYGGSEGRGDPQAEKRRLFQAIYRALRPREAQTNLLILEDLHWSDQASHELLHYLARAVEGDRVLILGTYRADEIHRLHPLAALIARLTRDRRYHEIRLAPLSRDELAQMLQLTLGGAPRAELIQALYERTEGNPFFTEEVLESLLDHRHRDQLLGEDRPSRTLGDVAIPISIKDSILRRVADLDPDTAAVLHHAAVIGRRFDFELLRHLTKLPEAELLDRLRALIERQLIVEETQSAEDRYRFRHELIREAIYGEMLRRERRLRHQAALLALEELSAGRADHVVDQLAYHALHAREPGRALHYSRRAGERAAAIHAYREALGHYEVALEAGEQAGADDGERADLLARMGHCAYLVADTRRSATYWGEALPICERRGDRRRAADIRRWLGRIAWERGDKQAAVAHTQAALATLADEGPCRELAMAYGALAHLYMFSIHEDPQTNAAACIVWAEQALAMAEQLGADDVICHALNTLGVALVDTDRAEAGIASLRRSLAIAHAADLPADIMRAYINLCSKLQHLGHLDKCEAMFTEGWAYMQRIGAIRGAGKLCMLIIGHYYQIGAWERLDPLFADFLRPGFAAAPDEIAFAQHYRAVVMICRGQYQAARALMEQILPEVADDEDWPYFAQTLIWACRSCGDHAAAERLADQVYQHVRGTGQLDHKACKLSGIATTYIELGRDADAAAIIDQMQPGPYEIYARYDRAIIAEMRGRLLLRERPAQAAALFREALAVWEESGRLPDQIRSRRQIAAALLRGGPAERAQAQAVQAEARAMAERIGFAHEIQKLDALEAPAAPARPAAPRPPDGLTPRELEVLTLVTRGLSNRAIAETLVISEKTAEVHVRNILGKLGFSSRTQAATYAIERGIVARAG